MSPGSFTAPPTKARGAAPRTSHSASLRSTRPARQKRTAEKPATKMLRTRAVGRMVSGATPTSAVVRRLAAFPGRVALVDEGADAFLGVAGEHVVDHDAGRMGIGVGERHLDLLVEGALADLD